MTPTTRKIWRAIRANPIWRAVHARPRLLAGLLAGLATYPLLPAALAPSTSAILAWDTGAAIFLALSAHLFITEPPDLMPAAAEAQQEGEWTIFAVTLAVIAVSFAVLGTEFAAAKAAPDRTLRLGLIATTLLLSWLTTHVTFAYRYAHEFYSTAPGRTEIDRGLAFPNEPRPDYLDFLYFAVVIGMTFQVSDVQIESRKLRRVATVHGVLSFLFNTVTVALTVNIAAGLAG
jgi:hypothetical protein